MLAIHIDHCTIRILRSTVHTSNTLVKAGGKLTWGPGLDPDCETLCGPNPTWGMLLCI